MMNDHDECDEPEPAEDYATIPFTDDAAGRNRVVDTLVRQHRHTCHSAHRLLQAHGETLAVCARASYPILLTTAILATNIPKRTPKEPTVD